MSRILVIDEEPGNRLILKSRFTEEGHEVTLADTGAKGVGEARNQAIDVVLVSASLKSGISTSEVCRRLRSNPQTSDIPVVAFQNQSGDAEQSHHLYESGCDAFVAKAEQPVLDHVVKVFLRQKTALDELKEQNQLLEEKSRRFEEERQNAEKDADPRESGEHLQAVREIAAGRPEGVLIVDAEGFVRHADRGACDIFGNRLEGEKLGSLAPASGLEAFVRDARTEAREGFRFDLTERKGRAARSITTTVVPLVSRPGQGDPFGQKVVLLSDANKRRLAKEFLDVEDPGVSKRELGPLIEGAREVYGPRGLTGYSEAMQKVREAIVGANDTSRAALPVLVVGERGVGKERIARTLHYSGPAGGPFAQINCANVTPESFEREVFGYVAGAFEGAAVDRPGMLHCAHDGTLFLEHISELSLEMQKKILEVVRGGAFARCGSSRKEKVDVRIIAASEYPLEAMVSEGTFLPELATEFARVAIDVPPLRERPEDIQALAALFLDRFGFHKGIAEIEPHAMGLLENHDWPRNVAELEDCIEQACARAADGRLGVDDLPRSLQDLGQELAERSLTPAARRQGAPMQGTHAVGVGPGQDAVAKRTGWVPKELRPWDITDDDPISLEHYEKKALLRALSEVGGDKLAAARLLNVGKSTLYRKLKRFGIS